MRAHRRVRAQSSAQRTASSSLPHRRIEASGIPQRPSSARMTAGISPSARPRRYASFSFTITRSGRNSAATRASSSMSAFERLPAWPSVTASRRPPAQAARDRQETAHAVGIVRVIDEHPRTVAFEAHHADPDCRAARAPKRANTPAMIAAGCRARLRPARRPRGWRRCRSQAPSTDSGIGATAPRSCSTPSCSRRRRPSCTPQVEPPRARCSRRAAGRPRARTSRAAAFGRSAAHKLRCAAPQPGSSALSTSSPFGGHHRPR